MELVKFILKTDRYYPVGQNASNRMVAIERLLFDDIWMNEGSYIKSIFERIFSGEEEGFLTDASDIERIDADHVKLRSVLGYQREGYEASGTIIDKKQLHYLMDEWIRLTKARVQEITVTYDNGIYTIEGK